MNVRSWLNDIDKHASPDVRKILVGNNCHETQKRVVDYDTAKVISYH